MPQVNGPTIPRWRLGEEVGRLRREAGLSVEELAKRANFSGGKLRKIEGGEVSTARNDLEKVLSVLQLPETDPLYAMLMELRQLGSQRGWWAQFGAVPAQFATFLGLETSATAMKIFEPIVIHGLFQTEAYARAVEETATGRIPPEEVERQVQIRLARQKLILEREEPLDLWLVLDEAALHRQFGGPQVMKAQLSHLLEMTDRATIQVIPYDQGGHAGTLGSFIIFEFDEDLHSPVVYVEGQAGNIYMEKSKDLYRCNLAYSHITAAALSARETAKLISAVRDDLP